MSAPAPEASAGKIWFGRAVMIITGSKFSAASRSRVSQPFCTGRFRSSSTRSGAVFRASAPQSVRSGNHNVILLLQDALQHPAHPWIIIHQQDFLLHHQKNFPVAGSRA